MLTNLRSKKITVMGLGRFGGGVGVARWLAEQGARVTVTDTACAAELADSIAKLEGLAITFKLGGHDLADFLPPQCDLWSPTPQLTRPRASTSRPPSRPASPSPRR